MIEYLWRPLSAISLSLLLGVVQASVFCSDQIAATAPDSRYQDNGDGTVTDLVTGLIWKQCAEGMSGAGCASGSVETFNWQKALQRAEDSNFAGSSDWRLPNKNELASLVERRCFGSAINESYFPNTPYSGSFWSSTPYNSPYFVWYVDFRYGLVSHDTKIDNNYVRLVRAGQ
ncbi:protein of unknown function DUF1566 [Thiorhodococcus drewsii AZ1]|uniref:Lcl C-terminal domain-containing protein n=1 Tax=Thiorhodococcus drewsii AZ1 TaxID=765913 RepID=G2E8I4_9GAMM|nr:DUF1566 domain-containing protein [Thiorhodococcus drewsii]EGV27587.1 protein of unknown function DUF1566 [Thiorhodococcus drewsii AZ1]